MACANRTLPKKIINYDQRQKLKLLDEFQNKQKSSNYQIINKLLRTTLAVSEYWYHNVVTVNFFFLLLLQGKINPLFCARRVSYSEVASTGHTVFAEEISSHMQAVLFYAFHCDETVTAVHFKASTLYK